MITLKTLLQGLVVLTLNAFQTPVFFQEVPLNTHKKYVFPMHHSGRLSMMGAFEFHFAPPLSIFFLFLPSAHLTLN